MELLSPQHVQAWGASGKWQSKGSWKAPQKLWSVRGRDVWTQIYRLCWDVSRILLIIHHTPSIISRWACSNSLLLKDKKKRYLQLSICILSMNWSFIGTTYGIYIFFLLDLSFCCFFIILSIAYCRDIQVELQTKHNINNSNSTKSGRFFEILLSVDS